jgi:hypothetical protein
VGDVFHTFDGHCSPFITSKGKLTRQFFGRMVFCLPMSATDWKQGPTQALSIAVDLDALRVRLQKMSDDELLRFGKQIHDLVYPLTYGANGKPSVSAFSIQLDEARKEWRRRNAP